MNDIERFKAYLEERLPQETDPHKAEVVSELLDHFRERPGALPGYCQECRSRLIHLGVTVGGTELWGCHDCRRVYWSNRTV